jgi:hypothetical protein
MPEVMYVVYVSSKKIDGSSMFKAIVVLSVVSMLIILTNITVPGGKHTIIGKTKFDLKKTNLSVMAKGGFKVEKTIVPYSLNENHCMKVVCRPKCGYLLHRLFKIVTYVLNEFSINYVIISGTLLGSVRNKTMIEHTEDVDIAIDRNSSIKISSMRSKFWEYGINVWFDIVWKMCIHPGSNDDLFRKNWSLDKGTKLYVDLYLMKVNKDGLSEVACNPKANITMINGTSMCNSLLYDEYVPSICDKDDYLKRAYGNYMSIDEKNHGMTESCFIKKDWF